MLKKNNQAEGLIQDDVTINLRKSSIAEFTKRPVPDEKEMAEFEKIVENEKESSPILDEEMNEDIEESLSEIYQDDDGRMVDVKMMSIKKRHGVFYYLFSFILFVALLGVVGFLGYQYYLQRGNSDAAVIFTLEGENAVAAGEEYFYTVNYKNDSNIGIDRIHIQLKYPEHFQVLDIYPESQGENNSVWDFAYLPAHSSGSIKIKGVMIGPKGETGIVLADMTYVPENFSSEFKKEATLTTTINDIGLDFNFDYVSSAMVGAVEQISLRLSAREKNYIKNFRLTLEPKAEIEFVPYKKTGKETNLAEFEEIRGGVWMIENISQTEAVLPILVKFIQKIGEQDGLYLKFEQENKKGEFVVFYEERLKLEVMNSDLNLTMIINGSREDQGVNFADSLNYSIVYKNKGETEMKDVVIMAVLESDYLDWQSLKSDIRGTEKGNTIVWTKTEIPGLEAIAQNQEGTIDFSISLLEAGQPNENQEYQVKSYAQFSVGAFGDEEEKPAIEDNKSNTITNVINSDLGLTEAIRYFSDDNIPVGTGPNPPRAGETTSYKVYWKLSNNLHELNDLIVKTKLPDYVEWNDKNRATVGDISYDSATREVRWAIGRLPVTVYEAGGEFSISVKPVDEDRNKIMVLLTGAEASAIDAKTKGELKKSVGAKTTQLEDDPIAQGDGIVD